MPQYKNLPSILFSVLLKLHRSLLLCTLWHFKSPFDYKIVFYFHLNAGLLVSSVNKLVYSNVFDESILVRFVKRFKFHIVTFLLQSVVKFWHSEQFCFFIVAPTPFFLMQCNLGTRDINRHRQKLSLEVSSFLVININDLKNLF